MANSVTLSGKVFRVPEMRGSNGNMWTFSIAVSEKRKDEWVKMYFNVLTFDPNASNINAGDEVCVIGKLKQNSWMNGDKKTYSVEVQADSVFVKSGAGHNGQQRQQPQQPDEEMIY